MFYKYTHPCATNNNQLQACAHAFRVHISIDRLFCRHTMQVRRPAILRAPLSLVLLVEEIVMPCT